MTRDQYIHYRGTFAKIINVQLATCSNPSQMWTQVSYREKLHGYDAPVNLSFLVER